jgi:hypothetical protein
MRRIIGISLAAVAAIWPLAATCLSARCILPVILELGSYWAGVLLLLCSASLLRVPKVAAGQNGRRGGRRAVLTCATALFLVGWVFSNDLFYFWKTRTTSPQEWQQLVQQLQQLGDANNTTNQIKLPVEAFERPPLSQLGASDDFTGAFSQKLSRPGFEGTTFVVAVFGYKTRTWGITIGPPEYAHDYYEGGHYKKIGANAYFFCGLHG